MEAGQRQYSVAYSAQMLKVATINLYNFIAPPNAFYHFEQIYTNAQWQQKCHWLSAHLAEQRPDIVAFQEVFSPDELKQLLEPLGYIFFAVVDEPECIESYTYKNPVVCLASRFPILSAEPVQANTEIAKALGIAADFEFRRAPLLASIQLPILGVTDVYVVHFKSKRPITENKTNNRENAEIIASFAASIQRASEATQLMHFITERYQKESNPVILLGDFNDELDSDLFSALKMTTSLFPDERGVDFKLTDSWLLQQNKNIALVAKPASYYHYGHDSVLDYILLSNDFTGIDAGNMAEVMNYHCIDSHLNDEKVSVLESSDHAFISVTILLSK